MAKLPDYRAADFEERLAAIEKLIDLPNELINHLDDFMKFANKPGVECKCKVRQRMKLKKACKKALRAVAALGDVGVDAIMYRAHLLSQKGLRMLKAVPVEAALKWVQSTLTNSDKEIRRQAANLLNELATDFQGRIALSTGGGVLANIVSGPPKKPALLVALAEQNLELLDKVITEDDEWLIRSQVAQAMSGAEPSKELVEILIKAVQDEEESVQESAIYSLGKFKEVAAPAVPVLIKALDTAADLCAADALGAIGPAAKEAIPALKKMAKRSDPAGKDKAKMAISLIKG